MLINYSRIKSFSCFMKKKLLPFSLCCRRWVIDFFLFVTCWPVRPYYFHKDLTIVGSYLLAACDNIQKGHYISLKQLTNWLVTLFIMSHTCDKLFNSVTPNKSKSKQLANAVWGLFVAIYRCSQAVTALQSAIRGNLLMTHLIWQAIHSTHGSDEIGSRCCYLKLLPLSPTAVYMFAVCTSLSQAVHAGNAEREALCSFATEQVLFKAALWVCPEVHKKLGELYGC